MSAPDRPAGEARGPALSVTMITLNAEEHLEEALESVRWADEIVIVDSGSTDRTEEIARRYTDRFLVRDWPGYGVQKQRAVEAARGEWIFSLDADEVVTPELAGSIRESVQRPGPHVAFRVTRHNRHYGSWFGSRGWSRNAVLRVFRRDAGGFNDAPVHEGVEVEGPVGHLDGALLHYTVRDLADHLERINRYTSASAADHYRRGRRSGPLRPFVLGAAWFFKEYVLRGGFLYGGAGLIHAGVTGFYNFLRWAKIWELSAGHREADPGSSPGDDRGQ